MKNNNIIFCITDFETTGLDPNRDYPIEIACVFTDMHFNVINTYHSLIRYSFSDLFIKTGEDEIIWRKEYQTAYNVHRIEPVKILELGSPAHYVVNELNQVINNLKQMYNNARAIIVSDNAYFEMAYMKRLYNLANKDKEFPFHYSAWDTNLLLHLASDVGDFVSVHRAYQDAFRLYKQLVRCMERNGYFNREEK
jgi:oligoribonuclease (3'-5' exoribonuclease)